MSQIASEGFFLVFFCFLFLFNSFSPAPPVFPPPALLILNEIAPNYLGPRSRPSGPNRIPTPERGPALGAACPPRLIYLGRATPPFAFQIQQERRSQLGRGRGLHIRNGRGVWGFGGPADPGLDPCRCTPLALQTQAHYLVISRSF